jgi:hypothetical protein
VVGDDTGDFVSIEVDATVPDRDAIRQVLEALPDRLREIEERAYALVPVPRSRDDLLEARMTRMRHEGRPSGDKNDHVRVLSVPD